MDKIQMIGLIGSTVMLILVGLAVIFVPILLPQEPEIITNTVEIEKVVIQDGMLDKLINEEGIDSWSISSYDTDRFNVTIYFDTPLYTNAQLSRRFESLTELGGEIDLILEEARLIK